MWTALEGIPELRVGECSTLKGAIKNILSHHLLISLAQRAVKSKDLEALIEEARVQNPFPFPQDRKQTSPNNEPFPFPAASKNDTQ